MGKLPFSFERKREGAPQPTILCIQAKLLTENERKQRIITINAERRREERSLTSVDSRMRHPPARIERPARKEENLSDGGELQTSHEKGRRAILNETE